MGCDVCAHRYYADLEPECFKKYRKENDYAKVLLYLWY